MTRNPILRVLSTFRKHRVRCLLIGGQACIIYGAAEFSRDSDFVVLCQSANLKRLADALRELRADNIYVPPLDAKHLRRGHACHFRCRSGPARGLRIDIMSRLRGCDPFGRMWKRRKRVSIPGMGTIDVIGLADLVRCKKTQREKDWLMLERLVENDIAGNLNPDKGRIRWWLLECRNADALMRLSTEHAGLTRDVVKRRPLLGAALKRERRTLLRMLEREKLAEVARDKEYWRPLREELERMRHEKALE